MNEILNRLFKYNVCPITSIVGKMEELGIESPKVTENTTSYFVVSLQNDGELCSYKFNLKPSADTDVMLKVVSCVEKIAD